VEEAIFLSQRVYVMSSSPGRMQLEIAVDLPEHRDLEMKLSSEFLEIKRVIVHELRHSAH
jgi:NitT/TauT family transport system ATP-binding protein